MDNGESGTNGVHVHDLVEIVYATENEDVITRNLNLGETNVKEKVTKKKNVMYLLASFMVEYKVIG